MFNLVNGRGPVVDHKLAANRKIGMVSLTGSLAAGQQTMAAASANITKVSLELGGKIPAIVMSDADLDIAVKSIIASRIINTGLVCNCGERVHLHKSIKDKFVEKVVESMKLVKVGNPASISDIDMGPFVKEKALLSVEGKVAKAIKQGAALMCGGKRIGNKDYFFEPIVLTNVSIEMDIKQEETFGLVLPIS